MEDPAEDDDGSARYHGLAASMEMLQGVLLNEGPFDAVIGFSQGGIAATLTTALAELRSGWLPPHAWPSAVVLLSGMPPVLSAVQDLGLGCGYDEIPPLRRPSLHVWGEGDAWKSHSEQLSSLWAADLATVLKHREGHAPPASRSVLRKVAAFLTRHTLELPWFWIDLAALTVAAVASGAPPSSSLLSPSPPPLGLFHLEAVGVVQTLLREGRALCVVSAEHCKESAVALQASRRAHTL